MSLRRALPDPAAGAVDLLVIGGGVYGICAALEAARRGLRVALIERGDFGAATSANSLQTMHGGLRYLQHLDFIRMRQSIAERRHWLRHAPGLVTPMAFLLPTFGHGLRGPETLRLALGLNDLLSIDRNRGVAPAARLPRGRWLSDGQARRRWGGLEMPGCNGAALWYDGFSREPGRLLLALLGSAAGAGASLANYCVAEELVMAGGGVSGAVVRDLLSGEVRTLRAGCVLNATGPWVDELTQMAGRSSATRLFHPSRAFNLVVPRLPFDMAIGIPAPRAAATYFIVPWGARSLIGTRHLPLQDSAGCMRIEAHEVAAFLEEINPALGPHRLSSADVLAVKAGLLPEEPGALHPPLRLQRHARIVDHATEDGIAGLVSIVGVKWTTARLVAQQTVQRVCDKLQRRDLPSAGAHRMYALADSDPVPDVPFLADCAAGEATLVRAAREEMAVHLADAVMRRTDLWLSRALGREALERAATAMAAVHGWSALQIAAEVEDTQAALARQRPGGDAGTRSGRAMRAGKEGFT